jgi:hypothetical protein
VCSAKLQVNLLSLAKWLASIWNECSSSSLLVRLNLNMFQEIRQSLWRVHMSPIGEMKMNSACSRNSLLTSKEIITICAYDISQVNGWSDSMQLSQMVAHCIPLQWNPNLSFVTTLDICSSTWLCNKHALINYASCTTFNSEKYVIHISLWNLDYHELKIKVPSTPQDGKSGNWTKTTLSHCLHFDSKSDP